MEADFALMLWSAINLNERSEWWSPCTLVYAGHRGSFELFERAESKRYFQHLAGLFSISTSEDLAVRFKRATQEINFHFFYDGVDGFNPIELMNAERLATLP
jgi:hypothetical protein